MATTLAKKTSAKVNYERLKEILSDNAITAAKVHLRQASLRFGQDADTTPHEQAHEPKRLEAKGQDSDVGYDDSRLALSGYDDDDYYDDYYD